MPVIVHVAETIAGIDALTKRIDFATGQGTADILSRFQEAGRLHAPIGDFPDNSTNLPGDLAASILVEGPHGGAGLYAGEVGPTVVYGRQRELGGDIYPQAAEWLFFIWHGEPTFSLHVHQEGAHYLRDAYDEVLPTTWESMAVNIAEAVVGS